jgi:hypothetical protein
MGGKHEWLTWQENLGILEMCRVVPGLCRVELLQVVDYQHL